MPHTVEQRFNLLGAGQDNYAGQNAQNPSTSRKIQSWLLQDDGQLHRELAEPTYVATTLSGPVAGLYEFDQQFVPAGQTVATLNRFYFAAARTNFTVGTKTCNLYQNVAGVWTLVSAVGVLADAPMTVVQENNFFLADGASNWLFDGTIWVPVGLSIPLTAPAISTNAGTSQVYTDTSGVNAYFYAIDNDQWHGTVGINYPTTTGSALATALGNSLIFNPTYGPGGTNANPVQWATLNNAGVVTGYTQPWSGATPPYQMAVICNLIIPAAGTYNVTLTHDDGAFFGFGTGSNSGFQPICTSGTTDAYQTLTAINGNVVMGGSSKAGVWNETFAVQFNAADVYPLEIDFAKSENAGQILIFQILPQTVTKPTPNSNPLPSTGTTIVEKITAAVGRSYWSTNADQTVGVATESSSSPIGQSTGPVTGVEVNVYQQPGLFTSSSTSPTVTGSNSTDNPGPVSPELNGTMVGQVVYLNGTNIGTIAAIGGGTTLNLTAVSTSVFQNATYTGTITGGANSALKGIIFTIAGFTNASNNITNAVCLASTATTLVFANPSSIAETHAATATSPANTITLTANATANVTNGRAVIVDKRCTHWNIYASESDGSKIGQLLASVPVIQNLSSTPYMDGSPFLDSASNTFLPVFRPVRNDAPPPSKILEVHKVRQWRREETAPNFFAFTANEEVTSGNNGDPAQCLPGANVNTVSDMINVVSFPDQSARLRSLTSHMDSLYMFSEKACYPLYGNSVDDFAIAQVVAFSMGSAGRFAVKSTPNGLVFITYDKKAYLFPTSLYSSYLAQEGASSSALVEIGKPMRNVLAQIASSRLDEVVTCYYRYGIRDWWVVSFPTSSVTDAPQAWVYDFTDKGWFQLQRGFASLNVFEVSEGNLVLIGGGADGNTYVIDDQTGTYSSGSNLPQATWQPALISFGSEQFAHRFIGLELEFNSQQLAESIQLTYWLDPNNVDSPGTGKPLYLRSALGANRYRAYAEKGAVCQRMLLQLVAPSNAFGGVIRGIKLISEPVTEPITGTARPGGV